MISLNKCTESCNAVDELSTKLYVSSKTNDINVKVFNMIIRMHETKTLVKHISCDCKCKFNSRTCNSNQKWNNDKCQCECRKYRTCKKNYSWNPSVCTYENGKYLKSIADTSVIVCDKIINAKDSVSTNVTNNIPTYMTNTTSANVASTVSINSDDKKVRYKTDCYILLTILLVIILI